MKVHINPGTCRRTNPLSSLSTSPSHTPTYTNAITMDSWSMSNPTGHPVRSQALSGIHPQSHWSLCAFTGMHLKSHWDLYAFAGIHPQTTINPQSWCPPQPFPPIPGFMFLYQISSSLRRDSTAQHVCSSGAGFNPSEFWSPCGLPVSCCLTTSVVRSRSDDCSTGCPSSAGPAWSSLAQDLYGSGRHESSIRTVPLPGTFACAVSR